MSLPCSTKAIEHILKCDLTWDSIFNKTFTKAMMSGRQVERR